MCFLFVLYVAIFSGFGSLSVLADDHCEVLLDNFAYCTGNFTYCAIQNARPIRLCTKCIVEYQSVLTVYDDISKIDPTSGDLCRDKLFNLDRLQVVYYGFHYVTDLWARASCDSCFIIDPTDKTATRTLTPAVKEILKTSVSFEECLQKHYNESLPGGYDPRVCNDCNEVYRDLNRMYNNMKGDSGEEPICMDIVDMVNSTRVQWAKELGCFVPKKPPEIIYFVLTAIFGMIPILFYLGAWGFITKKEQIINRQINFPGYLRHYSYHSQLSSAPQPR